MGKKLVICCDGTANQFAQHRTNVLKLAFAAAKDPSQLLYYQPGVGTMAPPGFVSAIGQFLARLSGLAFGFGLKRDVADITGFIMDHYEAGDEIYLFGFSRGAYTARAVAALLHQYGLLSPGNSALIPYAIRLMWKHHRARSPQKKHECFKLAQEFKETLSIGPCPIRFLGLWDTVSSVGWIANPLSLPYTQSLPNAQTIRHAVSIDEHRAFFRSNLVKPDPSRDIREVWFPGVHCDVGGGYPEPESGLSKVALKWMIDEATKARMRFDPGRVATILGQAGGPYVPPNPNAKAHHSLTPIWWPAEFVPKRHWSSSTGTTSWRPNLFRRRTIPAGALIWPNVVPPAA